MIVWEAAFKYAGFKNTWKADWLLNIMKEHMSQETFTRNHVSIKLHNQACEGAKLLAFSYLMPEQIPTLTEDSAMPSMWPW